MQSGLTPEFPNKVIDLSPIFDEGSKIETEPLSLSLSLSLFLYIVIVIYLLFAF